MIFSLKEAFNRASINFTNYLFTKLYQNYHNYQLLDVIFCSKVAFKNKKISAIHNLHTKITPKTQKFNMKFCQL